MKVSGKTSKPVHSRQVIEISCPCCDRTFYGVMHAETKLTPAPKSITRTDIALGFQMFRTRELAEEEMSR